YGRLSVQVARDRAKEYLEELAAGVDPRERERKQLEAHQKEIAHTFRSAADVYHKRHLQNLDTGLDSWSYIENEILWTRFYKDIWRDRQINKITADDLLSRMESLRDRGKTESARRLFEVARGLFSWAKKQRRYKLKELPTDDIDPIAILGRKRRRKNIL